MIELRSASHCAYKIRYHMVLCIKYRKKLLLLEEERIEFIKHIHWSSVKGVLGTI
jgi:putative transposase